MTVLSPDPPGVILVPVLPTVLVALSPWYASCDWLILTSVSGVGQSRPPGDSSRTELALAVVMAIRQDYRCFEPLRCGDQC